MYFEIIIELKIPNAVTKGLLKKQRLHIKTCYFSFVIYSG